MKYAFASMVAFAVSVTFVSSAFAQLYGDPDDTPANFISVTTTSTVLAGGAIALTVSLVVNKPKNVQTYLQHNPNAVRIALNLGAGRANTDLAALFAVDAKRFARVMRLQRKQLATLADPRSLNREKVLVFIALIEQALEKNNS